MPDLLEAQSESLLMLWYRGDGMRPIDADVLIKDLEEYKVDMSNAISEDELYINGYDAGLHTSICAVIEAVTIDAAPVVHGHWITDEDWDSCCSVCGDQLSGELNPFKYCPFCGALMDEVTE